MIFSCAILWFAIAAANVNDSEPGQTLSLPDGSVYAGPLVDGRLHGKGQLRKANGDLYTGDFRDGVMDGKGIIEYASGAEFQGVMENGAAHGEGRLVKADGTVYIGEFTHGEPHGTGTFEFADGGQYSGLVAHGAPHGEGKLAYADGATYVGELAFGAPQGEGTMELARGGEFSGAFLRGAIISGSWKDGAGSIYQGTFENWQFDGEGEYKTASGDRYIGQFEDGIIQGAGEHFREDGTHYVGEFYGFMYHGEGTLTWSDGTVQKGTFAYDDFVEEKSWLAGAMDMVGGLFGAAVPDHSPAELLGEGALYTQSKLLDDALKSLQPQTPGEVDVYAVILGGDGTQEVFYRETSYAAELFANEMKIGARVVALANTRMEFATQPMATRTSLKRSLKAVDELMDPAEDILFVYLSSHGTRAGEFSIKSTGLKLPDLTAVELKQMLDGVSVQNRVVVVSACYSGTFVPYLQDESTVVVTAARADRTSFGCADENDFTYFGRALFEDNLAQADSLKAAFDTAVERVTKWESELGLEEHSEPMFVDAPSVSRRFDAWLQRRH